MAVSTRPTRQRAVLTNLNVLPADLRAPAPSMLVMSLALVLIIGALLLFSTMQLKGRVEAEQRSLFAQLRQTQASLTQLSSPEGAQLRTALKEAQARLQGLTADSDYIAGQRVRWSMIVRALQAHPGVKVDDVVQVPGSLQLTVKGTAGSDTALMEFGNGLRNSGLFDDVRVQSMGGQPTAGAGGSGQPGGGVQPIPGGSTVIPPFPTQPVPAPTAPPPLIGPPIPSPVGPPAPTPIPPVVGPPYIPPDTTFSTPTPLAGQPGAGSPTVVISGSPTLEAAGTPTATFVTNFTATVPGGSATPLPASNTSGYEYSVVWTQSTFVSEKDANNRYPGTISGKLIDAADQLVPGAVFRIESYGSPAWTADVPSDGRTSNGEFSFTTLRRATYRVYVTNPASTQAAADLYIGTDGVPGFNNWYVIFRKNTPGLPYTAYGTATPTLTTTPATETPTASPTATPTFSEPGPPPNTTATLVATPNVKERAYDLTDYPGTWTDCVCSPPSSQYGTDNQDWFKVRNLALGTRLSVSLNQATNLSLFVYNASMQLVGSDPTTSSASKAVSWDVPETVTTTYYIQIVPVAGYSSSTPYYLTVVKSPGTPVPTNTPPPSSAYEVTPDGNCSEALANNWITPLKNPIRGGFGSGSERDHYAFSANGTVVAQVSQPISIDMYIFDSSCTFKYGSVRTASGDRSIVTSTVALSGLYFIAVEPSTGQPTSSSYVILVTSGLDPSTPTPTNTASSTPTMTKTPGGSALFAPSPTPTPPGGSLPAGRGGVSRLADPPDGEGPGFLRASFGAPRAPDYAYAEEPLPSPQPTFRPPGAAPVPPATGASPPGFPPSVPGAQPTAAGAPPATGGAAGAPGIPLQIQPQPALPGTQPGQPLGAGSGRPVSFVLNLVIRPAVKP